MICPECGTENRVRANFCNRCGGELSRICQNCSSVNDGSNLFCDKCGTYLKTGVQDADNKDHSSESSENSFESPAVFSVYKSKKGERKFVSVLFSDLSDYTSVSKKQDPEDVKELMSRVFGEITRVIHKYDGFIEKFIGDAVMAIFGGTTAHEDDPIRAILAAREIHDVIPQISSEIKNRINQPLAMHTGISTGLVVTGETDQSSGTHGFIGNTIINASRLCSFADSGDIVVDPDTHVRSVGFFNYKQVEFNSKKGEAEFRFVYQVLSSKKNPKKNFRFKGLKADLIGREAEVEELDRAVERLVAGHGGIFTVNGDAGTGKSRLVEEFRDSQMPANIQWFEGHAYSYSQNMPYSLLIDILNRFFKIREDDPPDKVRKNIRQNIGNLIGEIDSVTRYIIHLYSLNQPESEDMDPEFWQSHIKKAVFTLFSHIAEKAPTVFCFEDLHWADPSSMDLLHYILTRFNYPALFLCVYRPSFSLFSGQYSDFKAAEIPYYGTELHDLPPIQTEKMVMSLLKTESIPSDLKEYIKKSVGRNPFYLEEAINSLIESGSLVFENKEWKLIRVLDETIMPASIQGIISARLDRLGVDTKRIAQEASVIGRTFRDEILSKITSVPGSVGRHLEQLERIDMIRKRTLNHEPEYIFKHVLTQEAIYKGLLRRDRSEIHGRIAKVLEIQFEDRLSEFYETLAFHFNAGGFKEKSIKYTIKSGEKNLQLFALDSAHQYFKEAYIAIKNYPNNITGKREKLLDLIYRWAMIFHHRGDFRGMENLFKSHLSMAESLNDNEKIGEFYMWLGQALQMRLKTNESYGCLLKSFRLGEKFNELQVIGWATAYLPVVSAFLGLREEAKQFENISLRICERLETEHFLYIHSIAGIGYVCWVNGDCKRAYEMGSVLLKFGKDKSNTRGIVLGYLTIGHSYLISGDFPSAYKYYKKSAENSVDPLHFSFASTMLGVCNLVEERFDEAEGYFEEVITFSKKFGLEALGIVASMWQGVIMINNGKMAAGLNMMKNARKYFIKNKIKFLISLSSFTFGKVFFEIASRKKKLNLSTLIRNSIFIIMNAPIAFRKSEHYLKNSISIAEEIGAGDVLGQAQLTLGLLYKLKGNKTDFARKNLFKAVETFKSNGADNFRRQAEESIIDL